MIHHTAVIHPTAVIGKTTWVGPFCVIGPNVTIGEKNILTAHVVIGGLGQWRGRTSAGGVRIGDRNLFHERTSVHLAMDKGNFTVVEDNCYIMAGAVVNHDCWVEQGVTVCGNVNLSGDVYVMNGANIGMNAAIHQKQVIGAFCMVGMGAVVTKKAMVEPGTVFAGNPARYMKRNAVGLERAGITEEQLEAEKERFEAIHASRA